MKWLVTVRGGDSLSTVNERLHDLNCEIADDSTLVPLSGDEVTISVDGPKDLPKLLKDDELITGVFKSSDIFLS